MDINATGRQVIYKPVLTEPKQANDLEQIEINSSTLVEKGSYRNDDGCCSTCIETLFCCNLCASCINNWCLCCRNCQECLN